MDVKTLRLAIVDRYGGPANRTLKKTLNHAIRTLPGGNETLDAIESLNAARIHAEQNKAHERVISTDAAIDRVEMIRDAMEQHIVRSVGDQS